MLVVSSACLSYKDCLQLHVFCTVYIHVHLMCCTCTLSTLFRASDISRGCGAVKFTGKSAKSCEIPQNTKNTAKLARNHIKYMSAEHISNFLGYWCCLIAVNLQIYLETSSQKRANNIPKLPGACTSHDIKSFAIGSFLDGIVVEKTLKMLVRLSQNRLVFSEICLENSLKLAIFYQLLLSKVYPQNTRENPEKSADFSANLSLKIL